MHSLSARRIELQRALLLMMLCATGGCAGVPAAAVQQIHQAHLALDSGRFAEADRLVSPVIAAYPDTPAAAEALYLRGLARLNTGMRQPARFDFEAALDRARRGDLIARLHAQLGNMDYDDSAYVRAAEHYRRARPELPRTSPTAEILLRYGISLQRSGRIEEAREILGEVVERYSDSRPAADARRKLEWNHDFFAIQCGAFAQSQAAQDIATRLRTQGVEAAIERAPGTSNYVVLAGRYRTYEQAASALPSVRRTAADAFVVP
ncbi:MAG TPA: SPOR domain-containing protein [Phycisphaerae bacterium]|jgi:tetratricopeptide (TPR) repeat protein